MLIFLAKLLLQYCEVAKLNRPGHSAYKNLQKWTSQLCDADASLYGLPKHTSAFAHDFVTPLPYPDKAILSKLLTEKVLPCLRQYLPDSWYQEDPVLELPGHYVDRVANIVHSALTVVAPVVIIVPIVVLSVVDSMKARIGVIAASILLFSLCLALLTIASSAEVFLGSAA